MRIRERSGRGHTHLLAILLSMIVVEYVVEYDDRL